MTTKEQIKAALAVMHALAEAVRELGEVPAGELYAHVAGVMTLGEFERAIGSLVGAQLVRRDPSHLLTWTGPDLSGVTW